MLALAIVVGYVGFHARRDRLYTVAINAKVNDADAEVIARGEHLARTLGGCAECHGADFGGRVMSDDPVMHLVATNLTRGKGSAVRQYSDSDWLRAIVHGVGRDKRSLLVMPSKELAAFSDEDLGALVTFLKTVPPVDRELGRPQVSFLGKVVFGLTGADVLSAESIDHSAARTRPIEKGPTREYGEYLSNVCKGCHGADLRGGIVPHPGSPPSADISPAVMSTWTFDDLERALRTGKRRNGANLNEAMPWNITKDLTDLEMRALWLGLRQE